MANNAHAAAAGAIHHFQSKNVSSCAYSLRHSEQPFLKDHPELVSIRLVDYSAHRSPALHQVSDSNSFSSYQTRWQTGRLPKLKVLHHGFSLGSKKLIRKKLITASKTMQDCTKSAALLISMCSPISSESSTTTEEVIEILRRLKESNKKAFDLKRQPSERLPEFLQKNLLVERRLVTFFERKNFIVKEEIELYEGQDTVIKLVELVEIGTLQRLLEVLENIKCLLQLVNQIQIRMGTLRLGITFAMLWESLYTSQIKRSLIQNTISGRVCCPASIIALKLCEHFDLYISWRNFKNYRKKSSISFAKNDRGSPENPEGEKHQVEYSVDVISWRERYIRASICIEAEINRVWQVLTDYERLAEFIPNLIHSARIPCPHPGRIWLLQRGMHSAMYWHIEATVVLDLEEFPNSVDGKALQFCMVDGDFKKYAGRWILQPGTRPGTTVLYYEVSVIPRLLLPGVFVERIIMSDLPLNLRAIAERAENHSAVVKHPTDDTTPVATPIESIVSKLQTSESIVKSFVQTDDKIYAEKWNNEAGAKVKKLCRPKRQCTVDEVHLRRLSEENGACWHVVAAVTIEASTEDVWNVLTAYETLSEFVPNLSSSKILSRDGHRVRVLQEGCKCLLYMVLHARVVLDLHEFPPSEIAFQQVEGDFELFKGKWTVESLGSNHTLLKYVVDMRMHNDFLLPQEIIEEVVYEDLPENLCAIRALVELGENCYVAAENNSEGNETEVQLKQDFPTEKIEPDAPKVSKPKRKPVPGLHKDFGVLERELKNFIAKRGRPRLMPMREQLREQGRVDLEKSIARFGGFSAIAERLNIRLAYKQRKPRGYWDDIENLRKEILLFQKANSNDQSWMPTRRSLELAGRYDIARALEKWGGLHEVANILGLETKRKRPHSAEQEGWEWEPRGGQPRRGDEEYNKASLIQESAAPLKTSLPPVSTKWMKVDKEI